MSTRRAKPKKSTNKKPIKKVTHRANSAFYTSGKRGSRGVDRTPLHILITPIERKKLIKLSFAMKLNAAEVVRTLINKAKV